MKKLSFLMGLLAFASLGLITTSCSDDEIMDPPSITITDSVITAAAGETVSIEFQFAGNEDLASIDISSSSIGATGTELVDTQAKFKVANAAGMSEFVKGTTLAKATLKYVVPASATQVTLTVTLTDDQDQADSKVITINVGSGLDTKTITLGAQANTVGSFCASLTGDVYTLDQAIANNAAIDIIFYYGNSYKNFLASPDDAIIQGITWNSAIDWAMWTTKNTTRFVKVAAGDFDSASSVSVAALGATAEATVITEIAAGDVYAFKTVGNKYGIIKVTSVATDAFGQIVLEVKIQKDPAA